MTDPTTPIDRRGLLKAGAAAAALGAIAPRAYAEGSDTLNVALVGCGGRGTGATANALGTADNSPGEGGGPIKLVAMADVFDWRLRSSFDALTAKYPDRVDVPDDRKFLGFDAYRSAIEAVGPDGVLILATPPAFRWPHFKAAIEVGCDVFMEKPVTVDAPTSRRMLELGEESKAKGMRVGVGLMCRHCEARGELVERINGGEIGDLTLLRAYRLSGPFPNGYTEANDGSMSELDFQVRKFHSFLWASGGIMSDFMIHNIDECCWMKGGWPTEARAVGGRHYRGDAVDQNFDSYGIEYTFDDGAKMMVDLRCMAGARKEFASYAHGTKGSAVISKSGHAPARCRTYSTQSFDKDAMLWKFGRKEPSPYDLEWRDLTRAIRNGEPFHEVERGVMASAVTSMGRMAAHTGKAVTLDGFMAHGHEFAPSVDTLTAGGPPPLLPGPDGKYPVPAPGIVTDQEYLDA